MRAVLHCAAVSRWRRTALLMLSILSSGTAAQGVRGTAELAVESRYFNDKPQFVDQFKGTQNSLIVTGDWRWISGNRDTRLAFEPLLRLDSQDGERSYADLREASISHRSGDWDLLAGVSQVFWGVAESRNIVDVINQFDTVEDFDQGEKLGQPMIRAGLRTELGRFEAYYLPYFRDQRLPGRKGRLRFDPAVDTGAAIYTRGGEEWAGDFALRFESSLDAFDVGIHAFHGTSRSPSISPTPMQGRLIPVYKEMTQAGIDVQYTNESWLLKFEGATLDLGDDRFFAAVTGFEYTVFDLGHSGLDLGIIGEYLYDGRKGAMLPPQPFDDDLFLGLRVAANDSQDTELLAGAILDRETDAVIGSVEFQRRLGARMLLEVEARYFDGAEDPLVQAFEKDSHLTLRLTRYF